MDEQSFLVNKWWTSKTLDGFHSHFGQTCLDIPREFARSRRALPIRELIISHDLSIALKMEGNAGAFICAEQKENREENEKYLRKESGEIRGAAPKMILSRRNSARIPSVRKRSLRVPPRNPFISYSRNSLEKSSEESRISHRYHRTFAESRFACAEPEEAPKLLPPSPLSLCLPGKFLYSFASFLTVRRHGSVVFGVPRAREIDGSSRSALPFRG